MITDVIINNLKNNVVADKTPKEAIKPEVKIKRIE